MGNMGPLLFALIPVSDRRRHLLTCSSVSSVCRRLDAIQCAGHEQAQRPPVFTYLVLGRCVGVVPSECASAQCRQN